MDLVRTPKCCPCLRSLRSRDQGGELFFLGLHIAGAGIRLFGLLDLGEGRRQFAKRGPREELPLLGIFERAARIELGFRGGEALPDFLEFNASRSSFA